MELIKSTAIFSLIVQIISGIFIILGLFYQLKPKDLVLKDILVMELIVQVIEAAMYFYLIKTKFLTSIRYYDWFISTPIMLISTILFLKYLYQKPVDTIETFKEENLEISWIVVLNFLMLLVGFMTEKGVLNRWVGFIMGTGFLTGSFGILSKYANKTKEGKIFLSIMFGIWALYGIAFLLPFELKNVSYNILDLFAKNFYGIFIYFIITKKN